MKKSAETLIVLGALIGLAVYALFNLVSFAAPIILLIAIIAGAIWLSWIIYRECYYKSKKFSLLKNSVADYIYKCNELNFHIEELKKAYVDVVKVDYGKAEYVDNSAFNYKRPQLQKERTNINVYDCSLSICRNAQNQPFKYICKYFNIRADEETLEKFEQVLNDFAAAEQGKELLKNERDLIIERISNKIPYLIKKFNLKRFIKELGFDEFDFSQLYFPQYSFKYVSAGGNSSMSCDVVLDIDNLDRFIAYLSSIIKFRKSIAGQRALMTSSLREKIKARDCYTCQICGLSTKDEPNLLLEIDHIVPLSKNGLTTEENLQTLCWKCNRSKGSKTI